MPVPIGGAQRKLGEHNGHLLCGIMDVMKFGSQNCCGCHVSKICDQIGERLLNSLYVSKFWLTCMFFFYFPCFDVPFSNGFNPLLLYKEDLTFGI